MQAASIPLLLTNKDVCVEVRVHTLFTSNYTISVFLSAVAILQAVTGSGKTLAYAVPVIEILLRREVLSRQCV